MNTEQFDKIIKDKLAQQHYVPSEEGWNAIQERVAAHNIAAAAQKPISPKGVASGNGARVFFSIDDDEYDIVIHNRHLRELDLDEIRDFKINELGI